MNRFRVTLRLCVISGLMLMAPALQWAQTAATTPDDSSHSKLDDIIKETQKSVGRKGITGLVWWIPPEFWEESATQNGTSLQKAQQTFAPMRQYTMVIAAVGKLGLGNINWYSENELRSNTTLTDFEGTSYKPLTEISPDAKGIASIVKPVLTNILGPMGQSLQIMFFPAKTAKGFLIADPVREGSFSISIADTTGEKPFNFEWKLPLTSLSPPKYCPVGNERVEANWKYCPWHGVKLPDSPARVMPLADLTPKDKKPE